MKKITIEQLPHFVQSGRISLQQGIARVMEELYLHPENFGLTGIDEDDKGDFVVCQHNAIKTYFNLYDASKSSFPTFLSTCIQTAFKAWSRQKVQRQLADFTTLQDEIISYEERMDFYAGKAEEDALQTEERCHVSLKKDDIMFIAMKHIYHIGESLLEKISRRTGTDIEELREKRALIIEKMDRRIRNRHKLLDTRNRHYFLHKRYRMELNCLEPASPHFIRTMTRYRNHTKTWEQKNRRIEQNECKIEASNKLVCQMLNVSERTVSYGLRRVRGHAQEFMRGEDIID